MSGEKTRLIVLQYHVQLQRKSRYSHSIRNAMKVCGWKLEEHSPKEEDGVEHSKKDGDVETKTDNTESERIGDVGQSSVHLDRV